MLENATAKYNKVWPLKVYDASPSEVSPSGTQLAGVLFEVTSGHSSFIMSVGMVFVCCAAGASSFYLALNCFCPDSWKGLHQIF